MKVQRVQIPTPFRVGPVNIYVVGDTLIDAGPLIPSALEILTKAVDLPSIKRLLITHGHVDHHGLASRIRDISGCSVLVHQNDENLVTGYTHQLMNKLFAYKTFLEKAGLSERMIDSFARIYTSYSQFGESCEVEPLKKTVQTEAGALTVIHTPGHTSGSVCFLLDDILFSGDTLLPTISTNPSMHAVFDGRCGLTAYEGSLISLIDLPVLRVLPGHGQIIHDHEKRIQEILQEHARRRHQIIDCLSGGSRSLIDIEKAIFGPIHPSEIVLALAECYDHLRVLERNGFIVRTHEDPIQFALL
ncbi:MAG: MBL fold metallo-hydrolase [Theionarchaea archaeon]|nr:MBL fold metallo-hydrolase [Theionarchaea archaeon]